MAKLNDMLQAMLARGGTSLQLRPEHPPRVRRGDVVEHIEGGALSAENLQMMVAQLFSADELETLDRNGRVDGAYRSAKLGAFHVRAQQTQTGLAVGFRVPGQRHTGGMPVVASTPPAPAAPTASPVLAFLAESVRKDAGEIIISANAIPRCRVARAFVQMEGTRFDNAEIGAVFSDEAREAATAGQAVREVVKVPFGQGVVVRFMASLFQHNAGWGAVFRPIYRGPLDFTVLGVPDEVRGLVEGDGGLLLVASGPGGGRSTLLAALISHLNGTRRRHIVSLESPVEIAIPSVESLVHQRAVGRDVVSFAEGVRQALQAAPDVIVATDVPDEETADLLIQAAEGNLVLAAVTARTPVQAIERIWDLFPEEARAGARAGLGANLAGVITVTLVSGADGRGILPVIEVVRIDGNLPNMIREGKLQQFDAQVGSTRRDGNLPFDAALLRLVKTRKVSVEVARRVARDPKNISG